MFKNLSLKYWFLGFFSLSLMVGCSQGGNQGKSSDKDENPVYLTRSQNLGSVDFGTILYSQSKIVTLNILNDGQDILTGPAQISNNNFKLEFQRGCLSVAPNKTCTVKLSFSGLGKSGVYQEVLSLGTLNIDIIGEVTPPSSSKTVIVSQSEIDFGMLDQKDTILKTLIITNTSQIPLTEVVTLGSSFNNA